MELRTSITLPERGKRDKECRQRALIEAATAVFAEHGYDAATTREIAERAGCAEGLIHRYFKGKRGLLLAILQNKADAVAQEFESGLPFRPTVEDDIQQMLLWQVAVMGERRDFMRVSVSQAIIDPELGRTIGEGIDARRVQLIVERLRRHQAAGRIREDVDLEAVAQAITGLGLAVGFFLQVVFARDSDYVRRVTREIAAVISRGIVFAPQV